MYVRVRGGKKKTKKPSEVRARLVRYNSGVCRRIGWMEDV